MSSATDEEKANMKAWGKRVHELSCKRISKEFNNQMKMFAPSGVTVNACKTEENKLKCRYDDVVCIDQTRVVLKNRQGDNDFIHANWVSSPTEGATQYICTQGPLIETLEDFWHMCFTEEVSLIVMFGNFVERWSTSIVHCSNYFPMKLNDEKRFGAYTVRMKEKLDEPKIQDAEFRVVEITCEDETVAVKHCFMRHWEDFCAPVDTEPVLKLWRWVRQHHNDCPVVVHCSAGVGRAGTFVGIELAAHRIASNADINMLDVIKELRHQRSQAVQSHVQFLYLHCLVLDLFVQEKIVEPYTKSKFVDEYKRHTTRRTARLHRQRKDDDGPLPLEYAVKQTDNPHWYHVDATVFKKNGEILYEVEAETNGARLRNTRINGKIHADE